ncbi:esterase/lipase family protein [Protaetiibacter mangrovi]|uniref:Alpha/beta hydrolase n=1 Tax=Protaetiibacter mangrovi TaxID=2970926 RepID=A0ABT1ZEW7_9MICO|nr:alpha/beta hydrolase [Protaetiibacter mangrovi]MCS0499211.1 alpha/beta hydrolase [Protaetiibacter mangrovi]TPX03185.1 alpha/beta hydrolase [Schumannella luteola]
MVERSFAAHAAAIVGDFPNAMRFRARAMRDWEVPASFGEGAKNPVVVLPGVFETWHYLRPVAEALSAAGHPVHVMSTLGINHRPIPESASRVWRRIRELELAHVTVVAHSKGGLIGKHLLAHDDVDGRIDRVVAIASPFSGSRMAYYAIPTAMREFRPDHPVIAELRTEQQVDARITSIAPEWDPHIPETSWLENGRNVTLPVHGHFRILLDPRLPALVVTEVERETEREERP